MANSIEQDAKKAAKRAKIGKIVALSAAVLLLVWTVWSVVMNLNKNERLVVNSFIKVYRESKEPAQTILNDCSDIYEAHTSGGKSFQYVIAEIKQGENKFPCLLIVSGKGEGTLYTAETLSRLDCAEKSSIHLEITERNAHMNLSKMQKTLLRYWQFHDVA